MLSQDGYVRTFGALTGAQAVQMVKAGLQAIYLSGWQVAGDANLAGQTYPDQSLYPSNSVPAVVKRLNNALIRADQINSLEGNNDIDWLVPILADAEAGFGGPIHAFELMKGMIEAGAAAVHYEDQLAAAKKCGHMGGKVLIPTSMFIHTLSAARLAADVLDVPSILVARTDARGATLLTTDVDSRDRQFLTGERTPEGYYTVRDGLDAAIARGLAYAPYAELLWFETSDPSVEEAREFAEAIHAEFPDQLLVYNCSPSFNWKSHLDDAAIARFQDELAPMGYRFQFITLAGWHMINLNAFELASAYVAEGMPAYVRLQEREFALESSGYTASKHQQEVGAGYFDEVLLSVSEDLASTAALVGSTESAQFS
jgi:isocitrate lyase